MKKTILYFFTLTIFYSLNAQVTLPYNTGFENATDKEFWQEYKLGTSTFGEWNFSSINGNIDPACVSHDYSPSSGGTLNDNWFVSPSFSIENGGKLDSISYRFSGLEKPQDGDTIGVYLLQGNQNPDSASKIIQLIDFRGEKVTNDHSYRSDTSISLESFDGKSFIALRYRNTNCSAKWLTVQFDDVFISKTPEVIDNVFSFENKVSIFPNPATNIIFLKNINTNSLIEIYNANGQLIKSKIQVEKNNSIDISSLPKGVYILQLIVMNKTSTIKILKK